MIKIIVTEDEIGKIYGCYKVIGIANDRISPQGQIKKYYKCKCINCGNTKELNAYKVRHNNYKYCEKCRPKHKETKTKIGKKFGHLTVVKRADNYIQPNGSIKVVWKCLCECGNTINVTDTHLKSGHTTSCGCFHKKIMQDFLIKDISGQKFGKLTVLEKAYIKNGRQYWHCKCDCGKTCIAYTTSLLSGKRKSCGCLISKAEYELSLYLDKNNIPYESQYKFDDCKDIRCLPFDFVIFDKNKNITMAIELNGAQHYHPFTYSNEDKVTQILNLKDRQKKDKIKRDYCLKNNIPLLVVKYTNFNKKEELFDNFYKNIVGEKYA